MELGLDGYILKKSSPSCGMERIRVYRKGMPANRNQSGLFARTLMERWPGLPVVLMLTSVTAGHELRRAEAAGVGAFVMKPFRRSELLNALHFALDLDPTNLTGGREIVKDPLSVLIVEDNVTNQEVAAGLLLSRGHRVEVAENGRQGVERFNAGAYDRVLMDVNMPEMDGIEATKTIRSALPTAHCVCPP